MTGTALEEEKDAASAAPGGLGADGPFRQQTGAEQAEGAEAQHFAAMKECHGTAASSGACRRSDRTADAGGLYRPVYPQGAVQGE